MLIGSHYSPPPPTVHNSCSELDNTADNFNTSLRLENTDSFFVTQLYHDDKSNLAILFGKRFFENCTSLTILQVTSDKSEANEHRFIFLTQKYDGN